MCTNARTQSLIYNKGLLSTRDCARAFPPAFINTIPQQSVRWLFYYSQFIGKEIATAFECPQHAKCFKCIIPFSFYLCSEIYIHFTGERMTHPRETKQSFWGAQRDSPPVCCVPSWCLVTAPLLPLPRGPTIPPPNVHRLMRLRNQPTSPLLDS